MRIKDRLYVQFIVVSFPVEKSCLSGGVSPGARSILILPIQLVGGNQEEATIGVWNQCKRLHPDGQMPAMRHSNFSYALFAC
jgi:hypothetical protein